MFFYFQRKRLKINHKTGGSLFPTNTHSQITWYHPVVHQLHCKLGYLWDFTRSIRFSFPCDCIIWWLPDWFAVWVRMQLGKGTKGEASGLCCRHPGNAQSWCERASTHFHLTNAMASWFMGGPTDIHSGNRRSKGKLLPCYLLSVFVEHALLAMPWVVSPVEAS